MPAPLKNWTSVGKRSRKREGRKDKQLLRACHHLNAILMGVVRQEVNTSAGNSALCGSVSCASQAASRIQSLVEVPEEPEAVQS